MSVLYGNRSRTRDQARALSLTVDTGKPSRVQASLQLKNKRCIIAANNYEPGRLFGRGAGRHRAGRRGPFLLSMLALSLFRSTCRPSPAAVARSRRDMIETARAAARASITEPQLPAPIRLPIRKGLLRDDAYAGARPRPPRSAWAAALWQESRALAQPRAADAVRQE